MKYTPLFVLAFAILCLVTLRYTITGTMYYAFLSLNIFLAAVPLLVEPFFKLIKRHWHGWKRTVGYIFVASAWLLFIPNAFYILTDFMHLNSSVLVNMPNDSYTHGVQYIRGDAVFMYDSLLIFIAVIFGAYAGGLALLHAYTFVRRSMNQVQAGVILSLIILLSSIGIFIGRFGRWNSWDALYQPWVVIGDLYQQLLDPVLLERFCIVVFTGVLFHAMCFFALYYAQSQRRQTQ